MQASQKLGKNIPNEIGNLSNLASLYQYRNELDKFLPTTIKGMQNLQEFSIINNIVIGSIPEDACHLHKCESSIRSKNELYVPLPTCLGNITSLRYLNLYRNKLNSSLPTSLGGLKHIVQFNLSSNFFSRNLLPEMGDIKETISIMSCQVIFLVPSEDYKT